MLDDLISFMQSAKSAMLAIKSTMETFQSGINMLASLTPAKPFNQPASKTTSARPEPEKPDLAEQKAKTPANES